MQFLQHSKEETTGNSILLRYLTHTEVNGQCNSGTHREISEVMWSGFSRYLQNKTKWKDDLLINKAVIFAVGNLKCFTRL